MQRCSSRPEPEVDESGLRGAPTAVGGPSGPPVPAVAVTPLSGVDLCLAGGDGMADIGGASHTVLKSAAPELPVGVVTFLFTDVVGSTAAWEADNKAMSAAMARHDDVIERIVTDHGGVLVRPRGEGDSRFAVFCRPSAGVAAALDVQRAMAAEAWSTVAPVRLRVAVHTGEAELRAGDYYGPVVNRAARLRSLANPGQVVLGGATAELVRDQLPAGSALVDLGPVQLRDVVRPERAHQLTHPDLAEQFPPPRASPGSALPAVGSPLVGRAVERAQLVAALADEAVRLVTLTGPGGCGKTRLALATATDLFDERPGGVWFVPLDGVSDPAAVTVGIAAAMGVVVQPGDDMVTAVARALTGGRALVVLDNFEQVLGAAGVVAALLGAAPALQLLVTSREPLRLSWEREFPVPLLALPEEAMFTDPAALTDVESVTLFVERARAVLPGFTLSVDNAPAVAELCVRLDGLPLAIELAAARVRALPPRALLELLGRRLDLLTGGRRDLPTRQQTLRGALDWSWDLLGEAEQDILRSVSVFVGGWTLAAARAVCRPDGDVTDDLCRLVERSLVVAVQAGDDTRFRLLESIREYAAERLWESGRAGEVRQRHQELFVDLGERLSAGLAGPGRLSSLAALEGEYGNLRAALRWSIEAGDAEPALRLGAALGPFWLRRSRLVEGRGWLHQVLEVEGGGSHQARPRTLAVAAALAFEQGDTAASRDLAGEALRLFERSGCAEGAAAARSLLATVARLDGDADGARRLASDALTEFRAVGDRAGEAGALRELGMLARRSADGAEARRLLEESLRLFGAGVADPVLQPRQRSQVLSELAMLAGLDGDGVQAGSLLVESLGLSRSVGHRVGMAQCLDGFAVLAAEREEHERAAVLLGAAEAVRAAAEAAVAPAERPERERLLVSVLDALGPAGFARAHGRGRSLTLAEAMVFAEEAGPPVVDITDTAIRRRSTAGRHVSAGGQAPAISE